MTRWRLWHGDTIALLLELGDSEVDAVITDPPYSSGGQFRADRIGGTSRKYLLSEAACPRPDFVGDNRDQRSFRHWCALWLAEALRVAKPGAFLGVFTDWRQLPTVTDAVQAGGWVWRGVAVWDKVNARPSAGRLSQPCEFVVWASKGPMATEGDCTSGLIRVPSVPSSRREHQTEKPVETMAQLLGPVPQGGLVLDPFAGSGSTGVACLRAGYRFLGFEASGEYARLARERLAAEDSHADVVQVRAGQGSLFGGDHG